MPASPTTVPAAMPPLWMISLLPALGLFASSVHMPSIPAMAAEFGVGHGPVQWTVTVYLAAMAIFSLIVGPMSDRLGRRQVGLLMLFIFFLGSVAALFAATIQLLLAAHLLQGIGASGGVVLSRSMVKDALNGQQAAKAAAQVSMAVAVAPMLAPMLGGMVLQAFGWRANFLIVVVFSLGLLILASRRLVETLPASKRFAKDHLSLLSAYAGLLRKRGFHVHTLPIMCGAVGLFTYQTGAPVLLIDRMQVSPSDYGWFATMPAIGFVTGTFITSRIALRVREKTLIEAGCLLFITAGLLILGLSLYGAYTPWSVALPMLLFGAGNGLVMPTATVGSLSSAPLLIGSAAALVSCLRIGAGSVGSFIITELPSGSATALGCVISVAGIVALAAWVGLGRGSR